MSAEQAGQNIGTILRKALTSRSLSMRKLSELTGIDPATVSRIINGKRKATLAHLEQFSTVLHIPLIDLLEVEGYAVEQKKDGVHDKVIEQLLQTSELLSADISISEVEQQLESFEKVARTAEGEKQIVQGFTDKIQKVGGVGPFIDQIKYFFERFTHQNGSVRELAVIGSALLYFIVPVDVIPDYIFAIGYIDDAVAVQLASSVLNSKP